MYKYSDGFYYFIGFVFIYDCIEFCKFVILEGLKDVEIFDIWFKYDSGLMSWYIWVFEIYYFDGKWYIYFVVSEE